MEALKLRLSREATARFGGVHGRHVRLALAAGAALGVVCGWAVSGVYRVAPGETAVVQRFGAYVGEAGPGLHYHLPWPLAQARAVPTGPIRDAEAGGAADEVDGSAAMLAADGAPVQVSYALAWRVVDPQHYLFHVADAPALLRRLAEGAVRRAVGAASLTTLLSGDRSPVETAATADLQHALDRLGMGVQAASVEVRGVDPVGRSAGRGARPSPPPPRTPAPPRPTPPPSATARSPRPRAKPPRRCRTPRASPTRRSPRPRARPTASTRSTPPIARPPTPPASGSTPRPWSGC